MRDTNKQQKITTKIKHSNGKVEDIIKMAQFEK